VSRTVTIARGLVRAAFIVQIVLGVIFWTGNALGLKNLHMLIGFILVLSLETIAVAAARRGVEVGLVILAAVWGVVTVLLGLTQESILVGSAHWVIRVLHLLVGIGAIGLSEALAGRIQSGATREPRLSS
jgi:hypothetical protein